MDQDPANVGDDPVKLIVRALTLVGALVAYAGLAAYVISETWDASTTPTISDVRTAALGALAVALGAGYAAVLGIPAKPLKTAKDDQGNAVTWAKAKAWAKVKAWFQRISEHALLVTGVILYLVVGAAMCVTYAFNESESPPIVKTIAVGFGGYVIAYIGAAYQKFVA